MDTILAAGGIISSIEDIQENCHDFGGHFDDWDLSHLSTQLNSKPVAEDDENFTTLNVENEV